MSRYANRFENRFDNYREITARLDSTGRCGHPIKRGDRVGWHKHHGARCSACWQTWKAENAEAAAIEAGHMPCPW